MSVSVKILMIAIFISLYFSMLYSITHAAHKVKDNRIKYSKVQKNEKTKFYNFDDLLIDGKIRKPQMLYTDVKQKTKFEKLLKLKKDFLPSLLDTKKDPSLR